MEENANVILEYYGWSLECESPLEIRHGDGSFASGQAAHTVLYELSEDYDCEVLKKPIVLSFGIENNFDPTLKKHNIEPERLDIVKTVQWVINNAESSIENSYVDGAPRRIEMNLLCDNLRNQLKNQLSKEEIEICKL